MIKKQECEAQIIMLRVVETEADRDITLLRPGGSAARKKACANVSI